MHARALLTSRPEGATASIEADVHDPETILRAAAGTLDLTQPVALMLLGNHGSRRRCRAGAFACAPAARPACAGQLSGAQRR
ncbi:SAM-dependent methyltransferase [Frankia sp. R82]|nr:SAM-dependent methyltransferase [Frankia sp. R82]